MHQQQSSARKMGQQGHAPATSKKISKRGNHIHQQEKENKI